MTQAEDSLVPYRIVYSENVREALRALLTRARAAGLDSDVLEAVRMIEKRLRIYPQVGEPVYDQSVSGRTSWIGAIPPLVVKYTIDETNRLVFIVAPFMPLPHFRI